MDEIKNLMDVLPSSFDKTGAYTNMYTGGTYNRDNYYSFETRAIEYLISQGWRFLDSHFITTDGDSFGPLVRELTGVRTPDGKRITLIHG